jgi:DNA-binding transcriptional LysR family regulator
MDQLDAMRLFVAAVDEGSLAAAARRSGRSPATVTRAVALLERSAGEALLLRSTRHLSLTSVGHRHVRIWREVLAKLKELEPSGETGPLQGSIVLTAPELFGRLKVMPVLEHFLRENPLVSARVLLVNRVVDLIGEGIDLAIRLAPLADTTLIAVKLGEVRTLVCATPEYLSRAGSPATPQDLSLHNCIGLNAEGDGELWQFAFGVQRGGRLRSFRVPTRLSLNNAGAAIDAAQRGQGIVRARSYQVADDIASGHLAAVLGKYEPPPQPAHLVFHSERGRSGPLRAFIDFAVPALRSELRQISSVVSASS